MQREESGWMLRAVALFGAALVTVACSSSSKAGGAADSGAADDGQPICVLQDGGSAYDCNGQTVAACDPSDQSVGAPCTALMAQCTGCMGQTPPSGVGAGYYCTCQDAGDGGLQWSCVGTEHECR